MRESVFVRTLNGCWEILSKDEIFSKLVKDQKDAKK
jgi:hypothetical protein